MSVPGDPQASLLNVSMNPQSAPSGGSAAGDPIKAPEPGKDIKVAPAKWTDAQALSVAMSDFTKAEARRSQDFDKRWTENDHILSGNVAQMVWPGTNVPRSSIRVKLEQQQLESLLPYLHEGIFQSVDGIFFDTFPRPGTPQASATATRELMSQQLDDCRAEYEIGQLMRSMAHHGTMIGKVGWCRYQSDRAMWVPDPTSTTGYNRFKKPTYVNRPEVYFKNLRDIYVDPSLRTPNTQKAQFIVERALVGYDELQRIGKNDKSYKLPVDAELRTYLQQRKNASQRVAADSERKESLAEFGQTDIQLQGTTDPARARFEVLEYWTLDRFVVILERKWVICNKKNPYGFIPYISCNHQDVLDSFYGKGLAELLEDEQQLQAGLINAHVDEVSLNIHSCLLVQTGSVLNKGSLRRQPGQVIEANAKDSVSVLNNPPVTQDWILALQQSQLRSQQITGLSDIITSGSPGQATSVTRTARGVSALAGGAMSRIQMEIERIEENFIVPMLESIFTMNQMFLKPQDAIPVLGRDGAQALVPALMITNAEVAFELRAASRMSARSNMQQNLPMLLQTLSPMIPTLREQGVKVNVQNMVRDFIEAEGWRNRGDWFSPMTPQEMQAMQQQQQGPQVMKQQAAAERDQARFQAASEKQQQGAGLKIMGDVLNKALDGVPAAATALGLALDHSGAGDA